MLVLLITSALAASLLVELGLAVAHDLMEGADAELEDERQMNDGFGMRSAIAC